MSLQIAFTAALVAALASTSVASVRSAAATRTTGLGPAVITDTGAPQDKGFNALCVRGLAEARAQLGVHGRAFAPRFFKDATKAAEEQSAAIRTAAREGYDPIVTCGYLMGAYWVPQLAVKYPRTMFATVDASQRQGHLKNVVGLTFADWDGGFLAGVAAAWETRTNVVGVVLGDNLDPADSGFRNGCRAGARFTRPGVRVLTGVSLSFGDERKCRQVANDQIAGGADVIFAAAGPCGLDALAAANALGVWGIGVDEDQLSLGTFILTSAVKRTDIAVFTAIEARRNGTLRAGRIPPGTDMQFDVATGGVGFGRVSPHAPHRAGLIAQLVDARGRLARGSIKSPGP